VCEKKILAIESPFFAVRSSIRKDGYQLRNS